MKILVALLTAAVLLTASTSADAKHRHHTKHQRTQVTYAVQGCQYDNNGRTTCGVGSTDTISNPARPVRAQRLAGDGKVVGGRHAGDPYAFCGAEAARYVFGVAKRELWLAANWLKFPRTSPAPGMAAARRGHVMVLMSHVEGSNWMVHDGNSGGHLTREHVRSIAGYAIVDPHSTRMASR